MRYTKTDAGKHAISDRSITLSSRQRSALIILNGERSVEDVLKLMAGLGVNKADIEHMEDLGFIAKIVDDASLATARFAAEENENVTINSNVVLGEAQARYSRAYPLATQLTAKLGLRGFRLNLAVEAAGSYSQLMELFPKIKEAAGAEKSLPLENALRGIV